jgi:hypothetical protein
MHIVPVTALRFLRDESKANRTEVVPGTPDLRISMDCGLRVSIP